MAIKQTERSSLVSLLLLVVTGLLLMPVIWYLVTQYQNAESMRHGAERHGIETQLLLMTMVVVIPPVLLGTAGFGLAMGRSAADRSRFASAGVLVGSAIVFCLALAWFLTALARFSFGF